MTLPRPPCRRRLNSSIPCQAPPTPQPHPPSLLLTFPLASAEPCPLPLLPTFTPSERRGDHRSGRRGRLPLLHLLRLRPRRKENVARRRHRRHLAAAPAVDLRGFLLLDGRACALAHIAHLRFGAGRGARARHLAPPLPPCPPKPPPPRVLCLAPPRSPSPT